MIRAAILASYVSRRGGGLFDAVRRMVQELHETPMDIRVFGVRDQSSEKDLLEWAPVQVDALEPKGPSFFFYSPGFRRELEAYAPQILHTHGLWVYPSVAARAYAQRHQRPYLITPHGMLDTWAVNNSRWKKILAYMLYERAHLKGARCIQALCEPEVCSIRQFGLKNDIALIPNGVDLPVGDVDAPPPWSGYVEPGVKVLLYLSRLHPQKGLMNLLKAWKLAFQSGASVGQSKEWVLAMAGWDQVGHEQELKKLATDLGLRWFDIREKERFTGGVAAPAVLFLGPQFGDAKEACYRHCNAFVLPSLSEGMPIVVLEAWVHSKPALLTPQCNIPEGVKAGAALEVESTVEKVADGLRQLCLDMSESDRLSMGNRGNNLARERYVWPRLAEQMAGVYKWMVGGGDKPECIIPYSCGQQ